MRWIRCWRFAVDAAALDPEIASVLLVIDTPGGSVDGIAEVAGTAIYAARQIKPVRAQVDGMMASAGFYVGSQAETIAAHRMDLIGSVVTRRFGCMTTAASIGIWASRRCRSIRAPTNPPA